MKTLIISLILLIAVVAGNAQIQERYFLPLLTQSDSVYRQGDYLEAYRMYKLLERDYSHHKDTLRPRISRTREAIDRMRQETQDFITQANARQRQYEDACLNYAIEQEKQKWLKEDNTRKPESFSNDNITELNLSNLGLVQIPEIDRFSYHNLQKIDLRGNNLLDSVQVYSVLKDSYLLKILKDKTLLFSFENIDFTKVKEKELSDLTNTIKAEKVVLDRFEEAYQSFTNGKYTETLIFYEMINDYTTRYKEVIKRLEQIVFETITLTTKQLDAQKQKSMEILRNTDIVMFDRAALAYNPQWIGCRKATEEDFLKIDSLNFSNLGITEFTNPYVVKLNNIKHINLLFNRNIKWEASSATLNKLNDKVGIYVSVYDLDSIPKEHWKKITGVEILNKNLEQIPDNILKQIQLEYLNLYKCGIEILSEEIGNLTSLTELYLYQNKLTKIPKEIGNLTNLKYLNLSDNKFPEEEKQKIREWLPNCNIQF